MYRSSAARAMLLVCASLVGLTSHLHASDKYATLKNSQVQEMLDQIENDIEHEYYDPSLHGMDLHKIFAEAREKIAKAQTQDDALLLVADAVNRLNDSHTKFSPPVRPYIVDYGFRVHAVGDTDCYVASVRPGSDAEAKGLKQGDRIVSINDLPMTRRNISAVEFGYRIFPQSGFHLAVQSPDGTIQRMTVLSKVTPGQREITSMDFENWATLYRTREDWKRMAGPENQSQFFESGKVVFWKLPNFAMDPDYLRDDLKRLKPFDEVVLDLRGNPGGRADSLKTLVGAFFERDVTIADQKTRNNTKPEIAKGRGTDAFRGKLIVLIDSKSASAAEMFARVVQLENRGTVLGDRSSGRVMESRRFLHAVQMDARNVTQYGAFVTIADVLMTDGKSLEGAGVIPDERILPTPADMAAGRDPVLARAAALAGANISPEQAGSMFKLVWNEKPFLME